MATSHKIVNERGVNDLITAQKAGTGVGSDLHSAVVGSNFVIKPLPNGTLDKASLDVVKPPVDNPNLQNSVFGNGGEVRSPLSIWWSKFLSDNPNIAAALDAMGQHPIATAAGATLVALGMYAAAKKWRAYRDAKKQEALAAEGVA